MQFYPPQKSPLHLLCTYNTSVETAHSFSMLVLNIDTLVKEMCVIQIYVRTERHKENDWPDNYNAYSHSDLSYGIILCGNSMNAVEVFTIQNSPYSR